MDLKQLEHFEKTDWLPGRNRFMLMDDVDLDSMGRLTKAILALDNKDPVTIFICSNGGDWYTGIAAFDLIRALPNHVTTVAAGSAMSMGSILMQAGDDRLALPHATFMVHNGIDVAGGDYEDLKNWAKHSEHIAKQAFKIYADASKKTLAYWKRKCEKDTVMAAVEAVKEGLVDRIVTKLP